MQRCPVVDAIKKISAGWDFSGAATPVLKTGSDESQALRTCDGMAYYMTVREMELARFRVSNPTVEQANAFFKKYHDELSGKSYGQVYMSLVGKLSPVKFIFSDFSAITELVAVIEGKVALRVGTAQMCDLNLSLPDINIYQELVEAATAAPSVLLKLANEFISYCNKLNVNILLDKPSVSEFKLIMAKPPSMLDMSQVIPHLPADGLQSQISSVKKLLKYEMEIVRYLMKVEEYQCNIMNHVYEVMVWCKETAAKL